MMPIAPRICNIPMVRAALRGSRSSGLASMELPAKRCIAPTSAAAVQVAMSMILLVVPHVWRPEAWRPIPVRWPRWWSTRRSQVRQLRWAGSRGGPAATDLWVAEDGHAAAGEVGQIGVGRAHFSGIQCGFEVLG